MANVENIHDAIMNDIYTEIELKRFDKKDVNLMGDNLLKIAQMSSKYGYAIEKFYGEDWTGLIKHMIYEVERSFDAGYCTNELTFDNTLDCFEAAFGF